MSVYVCVCIHALHKRIFTDREETENGENTEVVKFQLFSNLKDLYHKKIIIIICNMKNYKAYSFILYIHK